MISIHEHSHHSLVVHDDNETVIVCRFDGLVVGNLVYFMPDECQLEEMFFGQNCKKNFLLSPLFEFGLPVGAHTTMLFNS